MALPTELLSWLVLLLLPGWGASATLALLLCAAAAAVACDAFLPSPLFAMHSVEPLLLLICVGVSMILSATGQPAGLYVVLLVLLLVSAPLRLLPVDPTAASWLRPPGAVAESAASCGCSTLCIGCCSAQCCNDR